MAQRRDSLYETINSKNLHAYFTNSLSNLRYLTGFDGTAGALLVHDAQLVLIVDGRYRQYSQSLESEDIEVALIDDSLFETLDELLDTYGVNSIHYEKNQISYSDFSNIVNLKNVETQSYGSNLIQDLRKSKRDDETEDIETAIDLTLDVFELIESWVEPGLSEIEINRNIRRELESRSDGLAFHPLVLSGENTARPHSPSSDRILSDGDPLLVDMGLQINGYCSDLTRMFFCGETPPEIKELYDLSKKAAAHAFSKITPGQNIAEVAEAANQYISDEGYDDNLRHGLGHGVGLDVHEPPSLSTKADSQFETGMVVTLEPGIYIDGLGGGRIEHMVKVIDDGVRLLDEPDEYLSKEMN